MHSSLELALLLTYKRTERPIEEPLVAVESCEAGGSIMIILIAYGRFFGHTTKLLPRIKILRRDGNDLHHLRFTRSPQLRCSFP